MTQQTDSQGQSEELISAAIAAAEARSAAEIAVAIVRRADRYRLTAVVAAITVFALIDMLYGWQADGIAGWTAALLGGDIAGWLGSALGVVLALAVFLLCEHTSLGILLTPSSRRRQACLTQAHRIFLEQGVDATQDRLGLLICLCEAERQIDILPDRGIAAVIPSERWSPLIEAFCQQKSGTSLESAAAGLVTAVADELAQYFPPWPGQTNELSDRPVRR